MGATEGLSEGPVSSRPASLGLLIVTTRTVAAQLARSQTSLSDHQSRLTTIQSQPITELVRLAEISTTDKLPTVVLRKMPWRRCPPPSPARPGRSPSVLALW